jgi:BASS family bile acid:Na+ symporter
VQTLIDISVPVLTFTLLTAVGLDLTAGDFARVRRQKLVLLTGLLGPLVLLPPIAIGMSWAFDSARQIAGSLLLIAACPVGGISNTFSYLARASPALSVTLTGLSCLLAGLTVPALGHVYDLLLDEPLNLDVPLAVLVGQFFVMLTLPVGLGTWIRHKWPDWAVARRAALERMAFVGVGIVLLLIVLSDPGAFLLELPRTIPVATLFITCSALAGWATATAVTRDPRDRFTIAVEFGTRNLGVAIAVAVTLLGRVEFARFAYVYFLTEIPLMLAAAVLFRRRQARALPVQTDLMAR